MLFANKPPRFLAQKSPHKALTVLAQLRGLPGDHPSIVQEMEAIESQLEEERALANTSSRFTLIKEAFTIMSYRRQRMLCITPMMWSNLTGTNTIVAICIFAAVDQFGWRPVVWTYCSMDVKLSCSARGYRLIVLYT